MLALEISILNFSPWLFWLLDLPFKAGITFISEYSIVVAFRWMVIIIFQLPLFLSILHFIRSLFDRGLFALRTLGAKQQPRNPDGTFGSINQNKALGRPKKS